MRDIIPFTEFAPSERSSREELERQIDLVCAIQGLRQVVSLIPDIIFVLNKNRQIVLANGTALKLVESTAFEEVVGLRPGELIDCTHATESSGGCGTTSFCSTCGAVRAILSGLRGEEDVQECRVIQRKTGTALDLRAWASPLTIDSNIFVLFLVQDISSEKQRRVLERIFFHDILNTLTSLKTYIDILPSVSSDSNKINLLYDVTAKMNNLSNRLVEEINAQKEIIAAENNELIVHPCPVNSLEVLRDLSDASSLLQVAKEKRIVLDDKSQNIEFSTDINLISRVISNMIINALEAIDSGHSITLGCEEDNREVCFWVHNPGRIPPRVQLQIFQRSFSTKGTGRGLGTYSMRLIGERYLKGKISFSSSETAGTIFKVRLPERLT